MFGLELMRDFHASPKPVTWFQWAKSLKDEVSGLSSWKLYAGAGVVTTLGFCYFWRKRHYLKTKLGFRPRIIAQQPLTTTELESVRAGSEETNTLKPKCQFYIGDYINGTFRAYGSGVRMDDYAIFPGHVWADCEEGRVAFMDKNIIPMEVDPSDFIDIDTDLVAYRLNAKQWSTLGTAKPKIAHEVHNTYSTVHGVSGKGTMGNLSDDPVVFGKVCYSGTTKGGYSGAAYVVQGCLAGIHIHGGRINGGYSASYIYVTLCHMVKQVPEDSEDFLRSTIERGVRIRNDGNWKDLDTMRIKRGRRYMVIDRQLFHSVAGKYHEDQGGEIVFDAVPRDTFPESSGNAKSSKKSKKTSSSTVAPSQGQLTPSQRALLEHLKELSETQCKDILLAIPSTSSGPAVTPGKTN